jgi:hypothetical protein
MTVAPAGQQPSTADFLNTSLNVVSPEYFAAMGIRLVAGRDFTSADDPRAKPAKVVVNQAFVRRFFPNTDPLGQRFGWPLAHRPWILESWWEGKRSRWWSAAW